MPQRELTLAAAAAALGLLVAAAPAHAALPAVASGHRPGPDALYAPPPRAPQLESVAPFAAEPILVSGATAYRDGELLYQDFLHDDRGAAGTGDTTDPLSGATLNWKAKAGTLTYPTGPEYANNAADLVELRVKPLADATALRVTLNTLLAPEVVAFTVALGSGDAPRAWPHGAHVSSPAALFLTVHGDVGELLDAGTGKALAPAPTVTVDRERDQVTVLLPHAAYDPGRSVVRMAAGVGLWDVAAGSYAQPGQTATATAPGGAAGSGAALFNLAFRGAEPLPDGPPPGATLVDSSVASAVNATHWRELAQSRALADGDVSAFFADVDFGKLADGVRDDTAIPTSGPIDRILADGVDLGHGIDPKRLCGRFPTACDGAIGGQLQAYTVYVPPGKAPGTWGLTLLLHALNDNENQYDGSNHQRQLGQRGAGYLVVTPSGRGPDGDYTDAAEENVFATWADVARHYLLDPARTTLSGWSMGGGGTLRLMSRYPDLFARGAAVGAATEPDQTGDVAALRNSPTLTWVASGDEGTPPQRQQSAVADQVALGLDFTFASFPSGDHATLPLNDQFQPFADFLGDHRAILDPPHLTYGLRPKLQFARAQVVADHVSWLSGLRARDAKVPSDVDARSEGFGLADPVVAQETTTPGVLQGGRFGALSYVQYDQRQGEPAAAAQRDRLVLTATNLAALEVDTARARLSCAPAVAVTSDGPLDLRLSCPPLAVAPGARACAARITLRLPRLRGGKATVRSGGRVLARTRHRTVRIARPSRGAFRVRITVRHRARRVSVTRTVGACR